MAIVLSSIATVKNSETTDYMFSLLLPNLRCPHVAWLYLGAEVCHHERDNSMRRLLS